MADGQDLPAGELLSAFKALANPTRLQIMQWLRDPEREFAAYPPNADRTEVGICATHIQAKADLPQSTISSHMTVLEGAGLVHPTRIGKWTYYKRDEDRLRQLSRALSAMD